MKPYLLHSYATTTLLSLLILLSSGCASGSNANSDAIILSKDDNHNIFKEESLQTSTSTPTKPNVMNIKDTESKMIDIDVPADGNCLFWAVALSYLLPVVTNPSEFQQRFQKLFGTEHDNTEIDEVKNLLHNTPIDQFRTLNKQTKLKNLVTNIFRNKVVDVIESKKTAFEPFIDEDLDEYLKKMRNKAWGGGIEIVAIRDMLNCQFNVEKTNNSGRSRVNYLDDQENRENIAINLVYKYDNHYNFCIDENLASLAK